MDTRFLDDEVQMQMSLSELHDWQISTSDQVRNIRELFLQFPSFSTDSLSASVGLAESVTLVHIYAQRFGFLSRPYRHILASTAQNTDNVNPAHLTSCLKACKKLMEYILSLPEVIYANFTTIHWTYVVEGLLVLSRLTFLMAAVLGWDSGMFDLPALIRNFGFSLLTVVWFY